MRITPGTWYARFTRIFLDGEELPFDVYTADTRTGIVERIAMHGTPKPGAIPRYVVNKEAAPGEFAGVLYCQRGRVCIGLRPLSECVRIVWDKVTWAVDGWAWELRGGFLPKRS